MNRLSDEFISSCRIDRGKILRGENMSRIETFVDAAFAFAFTMLVLVFVYPIKLMAQATVLYTSDGALGTDIFLLGGWDDNQVATLFIYFGFGLLAFLPLSRRYAQKHWAMMTTET